MCVESLVTAIVDMYPRTFRVGYRREMLILGMSVASFFVGLIMLTEVQTFLLFTNEHLLMAFAKPAWLLCQIVMMNVLYGDGSKTHQPSATFTHVTDLKIHRIILARPFNKNVMMSYDQNGIINLFIHVDTLRLF